MRGVVPVSYQETSHYYYYQAQEPWYRTTPGSGNSKIWLPLQNVFFWTRQNPGPKNPGPKPCQDILHNSPLLYGSMRHFDKKKHP